MLNDIFENTKTPRDGRLPLSRKMAEFMLGESLNNVVIYDGKIGQLRREKNEVKEVSGGVEFGMSFDKYNDLKEGDRVECYEVEEVRAQL